MIKICAWCEKEFEVAEGHQKYCSDLCKRLRHNQKCAEVNKRNLKKKPKQTRICIVCGKEFEVGRGGAIICSDECREQYSIKQAHDGQPNIRTCAVCGKEFESRCNKKVCSDECRTIRDRKKAKAFYESYKLRAKKEKEQLIEVEHRKLDGKVLHKAQMTVDEYNRTHGTNYSYGMYVHFVESKGVK